MRVFCVCVCGGVDVYVCGCWYVCEQIGVGEEQEGKELVVGVGTERGRVMG